MPQVIELKSVCRSFGKKPDLADRIATAFGVKSKAKLLRAVDGVDLAIEQGEVLGLVGESGCGKSTLGRLVAGILPHDSGDVLFNGKPMVDKTSQKTGKGLGVQMIFQNPAAALDPRQRILDAITEAPIAHGLIQRSQARSFAIGARSGWTARGRIGPLSASVFRRAAPADLHRTGVGGQSRSRRL